MAYYCPNCGEPVKNKDKFCQSCGFRLIEEPEPVDLSSHTVTGTSGNVQYQAQQNAADSFGADDYGETDQLSGHAYDGYEAPVQNAVDPYEEYRRHTYDYKGSDRVDFSSNRSYHQSSYRSGSRTSSFGEEYIIDPHWPLRSKIAAGVLAIVLGGFGAHKFYLGKYWEGVLMAIFWWTGIPWLIGLIQGITYLTQSDGEFCVKNQVRVD